MTTSAGDILSPLGPQDPRETAGYQLLARIGEGGMGTVYLSHTRGGQPVALKVIRREYGRDADFRRRFEQEVQAARRVQGYHIVPVVDHDTSGELPWLASAFIPGIPLHDALAAYGPLPLPAVFQLVGCTARALTSVHAADVIHRDLKPSNILLGPGGPYVIDFGIARAADATQLTQSGGLIGTPQYMSPEHALGDPVGPATDVFSLGLIAAITATGRHPYGDGGAITIAAQIANTAHRPPRLSSYDEQLRPVLERCLTADPAERIGTEELAALCQELAGRNLSDFNGWLPAPLTAEIDRRQQTAQNPPRPTAPQMPSAPPQMPGIPPQAPGAPPQPPGTTAQTPVASPTTGFGPAHPAPASIAGYAHPPIPDPHPYDPAVGGVAIGRADRMEPRGRRRLPLLAAALVIAVAAGAGTTFWLLGKNNDGDNQASGNDKTSSAAGATKSDQNSGGDTTEPTDGANTSPPATANATYTVIFQDKQLTLRRPASALDTTYVDLDAPKVDPTAYMDSDVLDFQADLTQLQFTHPMGKATGTTPEECRAGAEQNPFTETLKGETINKDQAIVKGDHLCMVTSDGNLAMWTLTEVDRPSSGTNYMPNLTGTLTLWSIKY